MKMICFTLTNGKDKYVNPECIVSVEEAENEDFCVVNTTIGKFYVNDKARKVASELVTLTAE